VEPNLPKSSAPELATGRSNSDFALEYAAWPTLVVDDTGIIRLANPAAQRLFGSLIDSPSSQLSAIWAPENTGTAQEFLRDWQRSPATSAALQFRSEAGVVGAFLTSVCICAGPAPKCVLLQLLPLPTAAAPNGLVDPCHKQKLDCALQLARTVALDFNNALTSILGHTSLVLSRMEPTHPWRASLLEVEKSAAKAGEIANDLGTFSRQEKEARVQASGNLNSLVQRSVEFFQQNAGPDPVSWKFQLERKLFAVKFDEAKMQQALIKILENAVQASRDNGRINVQTRNLELTQSTQDRNVQLAAGAYVCIEVSDNGGGIEPEVLPRIFEPFFTTKRGPDHRGLGLAWVYGIVTNHGGGVAVSSQPGAGTSVRVYLPAEKRIASDHLVSTGDLQGHETILIVDDEDLLLTMGQTILASYGYRVLTANTGQKALEMLERNDPSVDLVITDLVMPSMSGRELVDRIRELWPGMRIICTSGYVWPAGQQSEAAYLPKPFTTQELLLKVKSALKTQSPTGDGS